MHRKQRGFSLIELLIVVAIILIIAAIAIPNFMRARMAANEASAVSSCRTINSAEVIYNSYYGRGFSSTLTQLGPPPSGTPADANKSDLIDGILATTVKSGFNFIYSPGSPMGAAGIVNYELHANPMAPGATGLRWFYTDPSGVIRQNTATMATATDSPV